MKVYIHYIGSRDGCEQICIKLNLTEDQIEGGSGNEPDGVSVLSSLVEQFVARYNKKQKRRSWSVDFCPKMCS